ncbi:hypothetical protein CCH79_00005716, partial [Gambusia affinis]
MNNGKPEVVQPITKRVRVTEGHVYLGSDLSRMVYSSSFLSSRSWGVIDNSLRQRTVNVPKTRRTYCKKCKKHQPHKVTQYKKGKDSLYAQGKRRYDRKQSGYGGQTKPIFRKKAKTTKKIVLRLECVEPNCRSKRMLAIKRCKHFELGGDKKRKSLQTDNILKAQHWLGLALKESTHFVGDPVEDVEYEKAQGKDGSGYGVDPFSPVNETLVKDFTVVHSDWGQRGEHCGPFHGSPVFGLQAVTESITTEPDELFVLPRDKVDGCILQQGGEHKQKAHCHPYVNGLHIGHLRAGNTTGLTFGREALEPELCVVIVSTVVIPRPTLAGAASMFIQKDTQDRITMRSEGMYIWIKVMSYSQEPLGVLDTHCMSCSFSKEQRQTAMGGLPRIHAAGALLLAAEREL